MQNFTKSELSLANIICWEIWNVRNSVCNKKKNAEIDRKAQWILDYAEEFTKRNKTCSEENKPKIPRACDWHPLLRGCHENEDRCYLRKM